MLRLKIRWVHLVLVSAIIVSGNNLLAQSQEQVIPLDNPGFESGLGNGWNKVSGSAETVAEAAHTDKLGLRLTHGAAVGDSSVFSDRYPVQPGKIYQGTFWARNVSGFGAGVFLRFYDANGKALAQTHDEQVALGLGPIEIPKSQTDWKQFVIRKTAPPNAATVAYYAKTYIGFAVTSDFDDFTLAEEPNDGVPAAPANTNAPASGASSTKANTTPASPGSA